MIFPFLIILTLSYLLLSYNSQTVRTWTAQHLLNKHHIKLRDLRLTLWILLLVLLTGRTAFEQTKSVIQRLKAGASSTGTSKTSAPDDASSSASDSCDKLRLETGLERLSQAYDVDHNYLKIISYNEAPVVIRRVIINGREGKDGCDEDILEGAKAALSGGVLEQDMKVFERKIKTGGELLRTGDAWEGKYYPSDQCGDVVVTVKVILKGDVECNYDMSALQDRR